jgi:hypothetical protein
MTKDEYDAELIQIRLHIAETDKFHAEQHKLAAENLLLGKHLWVQIAIAAGAMISAAGVFMGAGIALGKLLL